MAKNTKIEWCDHSFNPWVGCTKISPGCDNCYAERWACRFGTVGWGAKANRRKTSAQNWRQPIQWNRQAEIQFNAWERFKTDYNLSDSEMIVRGFIKPRRPRVFCGSLCDVFDNAVPDEWRVELFELMSTTPHLDWLLLTKRIGNVMEMLERCAIKIESHPDWSDEGNPPHAALRDWLANWFLLRLAPKNIWLGATICNQEEADRDIPKLLATPAAVRFVSMEPLLGSVDLAQACAKYHWTDGDGVECVAMPRHLDWVIVGGETGKHARPLHPDWVRNLRDQCRSAGVPFCFKQWGMWAPAEALIDELIGDFAEAWIRGDGFVIEGGEVDFFGDDAVLYRTGKKSAGRLLDGHVWDEVPEC